ISSAYTTKRFPSRCSSVILIVRLSRSRAETQLKLQSALLRLAAMISQSFIGTEALLIIQHRPWRGFAHFKLCAHFLESRSESFNLLLLFGYDRSLFLHFAVLF